MLSVRNFDEAISVEEQIGAACLLVEAGERSAGVASLVEAGVRTDNKRNADRILSRMMKYRMYSEAEEFLSQCKQRFGSPPPYAMGERVDLAAHRANYEQNRGKLDRGEPLEFNGTRALLRRGSAKRVVVSRDQFEFTGNRTARKYPWSALEIKVSKSPARQGGSPATAYIRKIVRIELPDGQALELNVSSLDSPFGSPDLLETALTAHVGDQVAPEHSILVSETRPRPSRSAAIVLAIVLPLAVAATLAAIELAR